MNKRLLISLTVYLLATSTLFAQEQKQGRPEINDALRQVIDDCHTSLNIARPERPTERKDRSAQPSAEEIANMKKMESNRDKIRVCVESKGYTMPEFGPGGPGRGHRGPPPEGGRGSSSSGGSSSNSSASGAVQ